MPVTSCCYLCGERIHVRNMGHEVIDADGKVIVWRHFDLDYCRRAAERHGRPWQLHEHDDVGLIEPAAPAV